MRPESTERRASWRQYGWPTCAALALHGAILLLLVVQPRVAPLKPVAPTPVVQARLVVEAPPPKAPPVPRATPAPQPEAPAQPRPKPKPAPKPKPKPKPKPAPKPEPVEPPVQAEAPEPPPVPDPESEPEDAARREQLQAFADSLRAVPEASQSGPDNAEVASYKAVIARDITQNWSRPLNARRGMEVELEIQLVPSGELVQVDVVQSSESIAFDASAVRAVQKVGRFAVPDDPRLFDRYFRRLRLRFRPDDLPQ